MNEYLFVTGEEKHPVKTARIFHVSPYLPKPLKALEKIAYNVWWTWNSEAVLLFYRIDRKLWDECNHNPILVLGKVSQKRLEALSKDDSFLSHLKRVEKALDHYMSSPTWFSNKYKDISNAKIAYFSAEFGIHESLPIYSGGLGILAGDHLKSSSDIGLPLVGVGILYRKGYFQQFLNADGWQKEEYSELHFNQMPFSRIRDKEGNILKFQVEYPDGMVNVQIWKLQVGRNPLFLLDTDMPENAPQHREISYHLYGGDLTMRIKQEILLGIGGVRALEEMGITPTTYHMNEGHSAFLAMERIKHLMQRENLDYNTAKKIVRSTSVFTTHTPVPAGNDTFPPQLIDAFLSHYYQELGLNRETFLALGRKNPGDYSENFCMTVLALKLSSHANGVSRLHGNISRDMWKELYPGLPKNEIPIKHITNGIHTCTWIAPDMAQLYDRYLGPRWREEPMNFEIFERIQNIPADELWRTHERRRERLVSFTRQRVKAMLQRNGATSNEIMLADEILDPEALTIGFARRFATYKRGTLLFSDIERLKKIVNDINRPVQFIFAGKAHPKDNGGKSLIKDIVHIVRDQDLSKKIVFLENYDINVARYLVAGVDIWLNNPRRPLEASGTSGMKVPVNGGINLSVLDGWWCESYNGENGWPIGNGEEYEDHEYHDEVESKALYDVLERDIIPTFYDRYNTRVPRRWVEIMKNSMMTVCPAFNTNRMVSDYAVNYYINCHKQYENLTKPDFKKAHELAQLHDFLHHYWPGIKIAEVEDTSKGDILVGKSFTVTARIDLGKIHPEHVDVQVFKGYLDSRNQIINGKPVSMTYKGTTPQGLYEYTCEIQSEVIGHNGYAIRILPNHDQLFMRYHPNLITWE
jgi:starch phosphorylase